MLFVKTISSSNARREPAKAALTKIALTIGLRFVVSVFDDATDVTVRTLDLFRPPESPHHPVTFCVVDPSVNVDLRPAGYSTYSKNPGNFTHCPKKPLFRQNRKAYF